MYSAEATHAVIFPEAEFGWRHAYQKAKAMPSRGLLVILDRRLVDLSGHYEAFVHHRRRCNDDLGSKSSTQREILRGRQGKTGTCTAQNPRKTTYRAHGDALQRQCSYYHRAGVAPSPFTTFHCRNNVIGYMWSRGVYKYGGLYTPIILDCTITTGNEEPTIGN